MTQLSIVRVAACAALIALACACEVEAPPPAPAPPQLAEPDSPTSQRSVVLRGTKPSATSLWVNGELALALSEDVGFAVRVELDEGGNRIDVAVQDALGQRSAAVSLGVTVDTVAPAAPVVAVPAARTVRDLLALSGTKPSGATLFINGVGHPETQDQTAFSLVETLVVGDNVFRLSTMDDVDNESAVSSVRVERAASVPFALDAPLDGAVTDVGSITASGTRGVGVVVVVNGNALPAAEADGGWAVEVPLAAGDNPIVVEAFFAGEPELAVQQSVTVRFEPAAPGLAVTRPLDGQLVDGELVVDGTVAAAAEPVAVAVCVGACAGPADFTSVSVVDGSWSTTLGLDARADLVDGSIATVTVIATDALGLTTTVTRDVLVLRAAVPTGAFGGTTLALASSGAPFDVAWGARSGADVLLGRERGVPGGDAVSDVVSDAQAFAVGTPRITMDVTGDGLIVFPEASARTGSVDATRGVLAVPFDASGIATPMLVIDTAAGDVSSCDVALLSSGEAVVAFSVGDDVYVTTSSGGGFGPPVLVSDAASADVRDVRVRALDEDTVVLAWIERSDRDGVADDLDVVARRASLSAGPLDLPVLVTDDIDAFVDTGDDTLALEALPDGSVVVGTINGAEAWLFALVGAPLAVTAAAAPSVQAPAAASAMAVGVDGDGLVIAVAAGTGALHVARGSIDAFDPPITVSVGPSSLPALAPAHVGFADSRGVILRPLLESP